MTWLIIEPANAALESNTATIRPTPCPATGIIICCCYFQKISAADKKQLNYSDSTINSQQFHLTFDY